MELPLHIILPALITWTLNDWIELFCIHNHVDFKTAQVTGRNSNLHAWLYIAGSGHNSSDGHERSNLLSSNLSEFSDVPFRSLTGYNHKLIMTRQFGWNYILCRSRILDLLVVNATLNLLLLNLIDIELTLLHQNVEGAEVFFFEIDCGLWHVVVNYFRKDADISCCVPLNPFNKVRIFLGSTNELE